jgi:hypothetical protein
MLCCRVNCGLRSAVEILNVVNDTFDGALGNIPCYTTIENRVKKCGLEVYKTADVSLQHTDYALITDENMMIGSQKQLLTLAVLAEHSGHPLDLSNICVLDMAVAESWSGENISDRLRKAGNRAGHAPLYIVSDKASVMIKGARLSGMKHYRDISHSLGMYLERTYKEEVDFKTYLTLMTEPKFKHKRQNYLTSRLP